MTLNRFLDKWRAFKFNTLEIDGHHISEIQKISSSGERRKSAANIYLGSHGERKRR